MKVYYNSKLAKLLTFMEDDKYDLMRHPNIRLTEDGGAAPYDYTQAKDAADDIDYSPDQYDDFELLEPEDFLKP